MTFEGRNLYGHTYNHDEVFSKSKHKKWRPAHHELAFGKATTRPPWYRSEKYGGVSQLPPADAGRRYEPKAKDMPAQPSGPSSMLHHFTGESRHELAHSSNTVKGAHEDKVVGAYQAALVHQYVESNHIREANTRVHDGVEVRALVRRNNTNSSEQPLYPMSVVNDSFQRHLEARAIDHGRPAKPENAQDAHYTQKMYLPYERTRSHFPSNRGHQRMQSLAKQQGPHWWPGREPAPSSTTAASAVGNHNTIASSSSTVAGVSQSGRSGGGGGSNNYIIARPAATPPGFMHDAFSGQPLHAPGYNP